MCYSGKWKNCVIIGNEKKLRTHGENGRKKLLKIRAILEHLRKKAKKKKKTNSNM